MFLKTKLNDIMKDNKVLFVDDYSPLENINLIYSENPEEKVDFESMLDKLNNDYRLVVVMYYVSRFTTKKISEILNEKEGTIKSRLSRDREQLKTHYLKEKVL